MKRIYKIKIEELLQRVVEIEAENVNDAISKMCRRLHHPPRGARGADSPAFAGEGYKVVVPTVAAASAGIPHPLPLQLSKTGQVQP